MIDNLMFVMTLVAALGSGLIAGVFFAFSTFVVKALARLPPHEGIAAMQSINMVVVDSGFLTVFLATTVACCGVVIVALVQWHVSDTLLLLVGGALYLVGSVLVTVVCNVPLNDAFASVAPSVPDSVRQWANYRANWMLWNHVRAGAALAATLALTVALIRQARFAN